MNKCINVSVMAITTMVASVAEAKSTEVEYFAAAQVYDLTITAKTTQAQRGKLKKNHPFDSSTDAVVYRKQTTRKWTGVIWGCECESIMGVWGTVGDKNQVAGAVIWDTKKPYSILLLDDMHWHVLNAFDKTGDKVVVKIVDWPEDANTPIGEVSLACGFDDMSYFSRVFRQNFEVTPSVYRQQHSQKK